MTDVAAPTQTPVALRSALVGGIRRRRSRIRFRASVAVAASVAVVAALFGGGVFTGGPEPVLAIDDDGGEWVTVQILDGDAGAAEMTQELQNAGIDAEVQALPTTPDQVGRWMGVAFGKEPPPAPCGLPENPPDGLECANPPLLGERAVQFGDDVLRILRDDIYLLGTTRTTFYIGREPEPGEEPVDAMPRGTDEEFVYPEVDNGGSEGQPIKP